MPLKWKRKAAFDFLTDSWNRNKKFESYVSLDIYFLSKVVFDSRELFTSMVILDLLSKLELSQNIKNGIIEFIKQNYKNDNLLSLWEDRKLDVPDIDDTSFGVGLLTEYKAADPILLGVTVDKIIANVNEENLIRTFFSKNRPKVDICACTNALYSIYLYGKEEKAKHTENWIFKILQLDDNTIAKTNYYYHSVDAFLYFINRLCLKFPALNKKFAPHLEKKLKQRIGQTDSILDLAMRTIVTSSLGLNNVIEAEKLASLQNEDGSWNAEVFFKGGTPTYYWGCEEVSTAFCIKALDGAEK